MISTARSSRARIAEPLALAVAALTLLLACMLPRAALATQNDRSQPVKVSAKSADANARPNGVSHLAGDVVITQGTLKVTGASATIYFDADSRVKRVLLTGAPTHLRQMDDNGNLVKGRANTVDYNVASGIATLTGNAHIDQVGRGTASGDTLVYNTTTSMMTASSHGDSRVHMTFQPRQAPAAGATRPAPAATTGGH